MKESGILLHISCLPTKYGIGTLGKEAFEFIDFLKKITELLFKTVSEHTISLQ